MATWFDVAWFGWRGLWSIKSCAGVPTCPAALAWPLLPRRPPFAPPLLHIATQMEKEEKETLLLIDRKAPGVESAC